MWALTTQAQHAMSQGATSGNGNCALSNSGTCSCTNTLSLVLVSHRTSSCCTRRLTLPRTAYPRQQQTQLKPAV